MLGSDRCSGPVKEAVALLRSPALASAVWPAKAGIAVPRFLHESWPRHWRDGLALVVLWLLVLTFFWRLITPDVAERQYYVNGDFTWKETGSGYDLSLIHI